MNSGVPAPDPRRLALRVAGLQALLGGVSWLVIGYANAKAALLLEPLQQRALPAFFWHSLPLFGIVPVVFLPAYWVYNLADEASLEVIHDTEFLRRIFALPRRTAILDMGASVLLFFLGAWQLRFRYETAAVEAAKIEVLGFLTGVLFGILSYFFLQPLLRPLVFLALRQGSVPPSRPAFSLSQKIIVCCLAVTFIVTGLFGEIALSWAQRFAETGARERAQGELRNLADSAPGLGLQSQLAWKGYFQGHPPPAGSSAIFVQDLYGRLIAAAPEDPPGPDGLILHSDETRERIGKLGTGSMVWRRGEHRVVTSLLLRNGWRLVLLSDPDRETIRRLLRAILAVTAEVLLVAMVLAWAVGRGITRPLLDLEVRTRKFAGDPDAASTDTSPTDDEIGMLSHSFTIMEDQIRLMRDRLRETERRAAAAELLAGVAHEVRNPLFGITSTMAALEGELGADARFQRHFEILRKESERLSRMMEEMLALQRAPRRSGGEVAVAPLLAAAVEWARGRFPDREIELSSDCEESLVIHAADEDRLRSLFTNLLENAILSSSDPVQIRLAARREADQVIFEIEDHGTGIPPAIRDRLFEPFVSTRPGGTGMGLAICRQIVSEHDGTIAVHSGAEGGTIFTLKFPIGMDKADG